MGENDSANHDIVIIGAGVGGYVAAIRAGTWGARVALIEEAEIGGTCLNRGCIPTKTLIESAGAFRIAKGICDAAERDLAAMIARKDEVVTSLRKGVSMLLKKRKVEVVEGRATLLDARTVEVAGAEGQEPRRLNARNVILATGSRPSAIPGLEADGTRVFNSDTILDATDVGPRIVVVGGGILGCEFAYIFGALGYDVTVIEMLDSIVPVFSADAAREVTRGLKKLGVTIRTGTRIEGADVGDTVKLDLGGDTLEAETVLVAVGRKPNVEDMGLDSLDSVLNDRGFVEADAVGRTSVPGLRAVGDVTGKVMLAHAASHQGIAAVADCLGKPVASEGAVPWCAYTHPEVALVGMLEAQAAEAGRQTITGKFPMMALGRARAAGETAGYFKVVADASTKRVLGAEIVGPHATDLIHEAALAVKLEATLEDLEEMVHAHPTFAEGLMEAAGAALGQAIHV